MKQTHQLIQTFEFLYLRTVYLITAETSLARGHMRIASPDHKPNSNEHQWRLLMNRCTQRMLEKT